MISATIWRIALIGSLVASITGCYRRPNADSCIAQGLTYRASGDLRNAIASFDAALALDPDCAEGWVHRADTLCEQNRFDEAIVDYDIALSLEPNNAGIYNNRGTAFHGKGQEDLAFADFNRALQLDRTYSPSYFN